MQQSNASCCISLIPLYRLIVRYNGIKIKFMHLKRRLLILPNVISTLLPKGKVTRLSSFIKRKTPYFSDAFLLIFVCLLAYGLSEYYHQFVGPLKENVEIDLSIWSLPKYTFFSMTRGMVA